MAALGKGHDARVFLRMRRVSVTVVGRIGHHVFDQTAHTRDTFWRFGAT
jgi:hypothetical protein